MRDSIHVGPGLLNRDAGLEPPDSMDSQTGASFQKQRVAPKGNRHIYVAGTKTWHHKIETGRNNAEDNVILTVQRNGLPQDVRCRAEFALPERGADERNRNPTHL